MISSALPLIHFSLLRSSYLYLYREAVKFLKSQGYELAHLLERKIKTVSKEQQEARTACLTMPNTKDRREKIKKVSHAGDWFRVTNGGDFLNCDDAIIVIEIKRLEAKKARLTKKKKATTDREGQIRKAHEVIADRGDRLKDWRNDDLKKMIKWKDPKRAVSGNRDALDVIWDEVKNLEPPAVEEWVDAVWTDKDEQDLKEFSKNGRHDIGRCFVMRRAELRKMETFIGQVDALLSVNKLKVLGSALQNLTVSEQEELLENDNWKNHCVDDDYSHSTVSSVGEDEDEDESSNDQQQKQQTVVERQQEEYVIIEFSDFESKEEEEEEEEEKQQQQQLRHNNNKVQYQQQKQQ